MNRFQKVVVTGALIIAPIISAGAVSAAPSSETAQAPISVVSKNCGIDLNSLLQGNNGFSDYKVIYSDIIRYGSGLGGNAGAGNGTTGAGNGSRVPSGTTDAGTTNQNPANGNAANNSNSGSVEETSNTAASSYAAQVVDLVNQERTKAGLQPLESNSALAKMALDKAKDMYNNNYFDHTSPTFGSPFDMMKSYGISYSYAGENIAKGQRTPQEVMNAWMNSEGHRANILSPNFTQIGVAYYNGEWVQEFIAN